MSITGTEPIETQIAEVVPALAERGLSKQQAVERLKAWFGDQYDSIASDAVGEPELRWNKASSEPRVSDALIRAAVHYIVAVDHGLSADPIGGLTLPENVFAGIAEEYGPEEARGVLGLTAAGIELIRNDASTSISKARYDRLRDTFIRDRGGVSRRGLLTWPPTSQTVMKRLGDNGWNDAMTRLGLAANEVHDGIGKPTYSSDEYKAAVSLFLERPGATDGLDRFKDYDSWAIQEREAGRARPSSASVKSAYGSWNEAARALGESSRVNRVTERRKRTSERVPATHDDALDRLVRRQEQRVSRIEDELDELNAIPSPTSEQIRARDALAVEEELRKEQLAALHRQKDEARINEQRASRQFRINGALAGGTLIAGLATVLVPIFQHVHWWPFLP